MGRNTAWDTGSGKFKFRRRGAGELHVCCPTINDNYVIGPLSEFYGDSRFFQYEGEITLVEVIEMPEERHIADHVPEKYMPIIRKKRDSHAIKLKVAEEIERKQQQKLAETLTPDDITEAFVSTLPAETSDITIRFDFSGKGQSFTRRALRDIIFAYRGQLTMDSQLTAKRKRQYEPVKWDANTKWHDLTRSQLQSVARQLSISLGPKAKREDLIDAIRSKVKKK